MHTTSFEDDVRAFFDAHLRRASRDDRESRSLVGEAFRVHADPAGVLKAVCRYQAALFDAGLAWLTGPAAYGGAGRNAFDAATFWRIADEYEMPDTNALLVGLQIIVPAIVAHGTDEQRSTWLPRLLRGDVVGCQLFSEPDAGSDLASVRTRAEVVDDGWRINGQKVWSSGALLSGLGELLARTDPDPSLRHRGLSMFLVDMDAPGITVRPLRQMNGSAHFCEVYLDDVRLPPDRLLGQVGQGWATAQVSLASERDGFGDDSSQLFIRLHDRLRELARERRATTDPTTRLSLADAYARELMARLLPGALSASRPATATVAASLTKLFTTRSDVLTAEHASHILGAESIAAQPGSAAHAWRDVMLGVPAPRIAGGTDEIQRNIIAERGLGLPRDPR